MPDAVDEIAGKAHKPRKKKLKTIIFSLGAVLLSVLLVVSGISIFRAVEKKTHPILPCGLQIGDDLTTVQENQDFIGEISVEPYDRYNKIWNLYATLKASAIEAYCTANEDIEVFMEFNENEQLYDFFCTVKTEQAEYDSIKKYFEKGVGDDMISSQEYEDGGFVIIASSMTIVVS